MTSSKTLSLPMMSTTYLVACVAIWSGLIVTLHIIYQAANIIVSSLFATATMATVITGLLMMVCACSLIPKIKTSYVKVALKVCSFFEILTTSGAVGLIAMKANYSAAELDTIYDEAFLSCGFTSMAIFAVLGCINFYLQSRTDSIKLLSLWTLGLGLMPILLLVIALFA